MNSTALQSSDNEQSRPGNTYVSQGKAEASKVPILCHQRENKTADDSNQPEKIQLGSLSRLHANTLCSSVRHITRQESFSQPQPLVLFIPSPKHRMSVNLEGGGGWNCMS